MHKEGTGTEILELKLVHELTSMKHDPMLLLLLNLYKAYNTIGCGRLLTTLEGYGVGPSMCRFLALFWYQQEVVTSQNGYLGPHFKATQRNTQGGLISTTLSNLIFKNVVWNWLAMTVEDQLVAYNGMGLAVGRCMGLLYADDGVVGSQDL